MSVIGATLMSVALTGMNGAAANAANPAPTTGGSATLNSDGTVTVALHGTWVFTGQSCSGRYGSGYSVDWWGIGAPTTPANSFSLTDATEVTGPGVTTTGTISPAGVSPYKTGQTIFHVAKYYSGESVNSASTCTDTTVAGKSASTGNWAASATYPKASDLPAQLCVNFYDEHGSEGSPSGSAKDYDPTTNDDNSIHTNAFDPTNGDGYCIGFDIGQIAGHIYSCSNGSQTTTEVPGGTLSATGPETVASTPNPLAPPQNAFAGSYTMTASAPSGYQFVSCGGSANIGTPTSATETVAVPTGGTGTGVFYVVPVSTNKPNITLTVVKGNDADGDGVYHQTETAPTPGQGVAFRAVVTNTSSVAVTVTSLTDVWPGISAFSPNCASAVVGVTLQPGDSTTCDFTEAGYAPVSTAAVTNTVTVVGCQVTDPSNCGSNTGTSTVIVITSTPSGAITLAVAKTNDANGDGTYHQTESATTPGENVAFRAVVTNTSNLPVAITSLTDAWPGQAPFSPACATSLVGTILQPGASVTCNFTVNSYAPAAGASLTDTVTVVGCLQGSSTDCTSDPGTSTVNSGPATAAAGGTLAFTGPPVRVQILLVLGFALLSLGCFFLWFTRPRRSASRA